MMQRFATGAAVFLTVCGAAAQEPPRQGGRGGPAFGRGLAIFGALDTDHDNRVTAAEIDAAPGVLRTLDQDGNGRIEGREFPALAGRGGRGRGGSGVGNEAPAAPPTPDEIAATFMAFDRNADGKLTKREVPGRMQGMFARADANHDDTLTTEEIKTAAAAQPQPTAMRGGGPDGRGEGGREGGREGGPPRDVIFSALDRDGDGALSADEIASAPASLRSLDANGDGTLAINEVFGGRGRG
jgi:Ca2+-binding EF-hand superfamily protein